MLNQQKDGTGVDANVLHHCHRLFSELSCHHELGFQSQMSDGDPSGRQRWRTVGWQGSELVFLTVTKEDYHVIVTREVWALSDAGRTLTKTTRTISMDGVSEKTVTFEKQ